MIQTQRATRPSNGTHPSPPALIRAAVYCRVSVAERVASGFSSLQAQSEACRHYVKSQAAQGWVLVEREYSDDGFSGGSLERPGLEHLLEDIDRGEIDIVVVHRVDRISRSIFDFGKLVARFERRKVGFASVSQSFDSTTSMGRLVLNVLLSFAQFERELISERTQSKISAARQKGRWTGGCIVYGYKIEPGRRGLVIVPEEAEVVRLAFDLYRSTRSLEVVANRLNAVGHRQKRKAAKSGVIGEGRLWDKNAVHRLLTSPLYSGLIRSGETLHKGEHEAIVTREVFDAVAATLRERSTGHAPRFSRKAEYLLTGILHCAACDASMTSSMARGRGGRRYAYYRCVRTHAAGARCATGLLRSDEIERAVVREVKRIATDGKIQEEILHQLKGENGTERGLLSERDQLEARIGKLTATSRKLLDALGDGAPGSNLVSARLGELEAEIHCVRAFMDEVDARLRALEAAREDARWLAEVLSTFDQVWEALERSERRELLHLIVKRVSVDAGRGSLKIAFHDVLGTLETPTTEVQP